MAESGAGRILAFSQPLDMSTDQVVCANEIGVVGRFHQHIGQVMTCVGRDLGMQLRFGDWHNAGNGRKADVTIWGGYYLFICLCWTPTFQTQT